MLVKHMEQHIIPFQIHSLLVTWHVLWLANADNFIKRTEYVKRWTNHSLCAYIQTNKQATE